MARVLRGDILWAELDPVRGHEQAGRRPVLVISHDVFNQRTGTVIAMAVTSREPREGFPLTVALRERSLPKPSWVKVGQVRTLSVDRLGKRLGSASPEELLQVTEGLEEIIGA
jgi:mRNA interferase MazF